MIEYSSSLADDLSLLKSFELDYFVAKSVKVTDDYLFAESLFLGLFFAKVEFEGEAMLKLEHEYVILNAPRNTS